MAIPLGFKTAPKYLLRDRDRIYGYEFRKQVEAMGIKEVLSAPRSPWQRAYGSFIGSSEIPFRLCSIPAVPDDSGPPFTINEGCMTTTHEPTVPVRVEPGHGVIESGDGFPVVGGEPHHRLMTHSYRLEKRLPFR